MSALKNAVPCCRPLLLAEALPPQERVLAQQRRGIGHPPSLGLGGDIEVVLDLEHPLPDPLGIVGAEELVGLGRLGAIVVYLASLELLDTLEHLGKDGVHVALHRCRLE